ncbi:leukotoxin LktA family filamentous adhesin [Pelagibacterium montanilacus]|uniref:leukotoxin LktA family filamentous adhesin n=1 Tax=Pelagibacterium montanilacus TaxID=2185280 RepID=UPI0013DEAEA9|nr:leukotoxin LktA family filamentous adhesin [Pelagibacterium montanilacus]
MAGPSPVVLGLVAGMAMATGSYGQAVNLGGGMNNILADGRTQTTVSTQGNHTTVTTNTVAGKTGFNSFSDFQQAAGTRVDLFVPDQANNLVNIVRNGPVVIDGLLNSYKNGEIGGNVFFSSSQGFILGANGVVNVGALTVNTPTSEFLEGVISEDGVIDNHAVDLLMTGAIPISNDGIISISGTINARDGITLQGKSVSLHGGSVQLDGTEISHREKFDATVNTGGMAEGAALVSHGGSISIVAEGSARVGGTINAGASGSGRGGSVSVRTGGDIVVGEAADISADGAGENGEGGLIEFIAGDTIVAMDEARFSARGAGLGDGGFVELSGATALIGGITVDLGSDAGSAGTLLFDPWDLYIGDSVSESSQSDDYSATPNIVTGGANVILQADNSITVLSGGLIDTRNGTGNAGSITLEAGSITIGDGAQLLASSNGTGAAGDITLRATRTDGTTAAIIIGSTGGTAPIISGADISFLASSTRQSGIALVDIASATASVTVNSGQISATGQFKADATASIDSSLGNLPLGVITADVDATVRIGGQASISAASAALNASSSATIVIETASLAPDNSAADGAVAVSVIASTAEVEVAGSAELDITGLLDMSATNVVEATVSAEPDEVAFGASVAVSVIDADTIVTIGGNADISAGSVSLDADTSTMATVTAAAAAGGASEPQGGSETASYLDQYGDNAQTSDGGVSVVGAFAVSDLNSTTLVQLTSTQALDATGAVTLESLSTNGATITADGSAVDSDIGVGVALGINLGHVGNDIVISQAIDAASLSANAAMSGSGVNTFSTTTSSGAGAGSVGIAGAFSINLIDTQASAVISEGVAVNLAGGDASLSADNQTNITASATPSGEDGGGATGDTVGIGASVAINILANRSVTELQNGATLAGAQDVSLSASGAHESEAEAIAGSSGGISITPSLGLSLITNTATARLGTGSTLTTSGDVTLSAIQQSTTSTTASGKAAGGVAVGAALALSLIDDVVEATTARNVNAGGDVRFVAAGASHATLVAEAGATGAPAEDQEEGGEGGEESSVDSQVSGQFDSATARQSDAGVGSSEQQDATADAVADEEGRSASTSEGQVSVAAAVAINVQKAQVSAGVPDNVAITSAGSLTLEAIGNTDGKLDADGSAVGDGTSQDNAIGVGVAVSVNHVRASTIARLGSATHTLGGLNVRALSLDIAEWRSDSATTETHTDTFEAFAASGAGASSVGIAGALGLNLIDAESSATIAPNAVVNLTGSGSVALLADARTSTTAKALPAGADDEGEGGGATGGSVGIGASVAINIVANRAVADIGDGAVLNDAGDISLDAAGTHEAGTEAEAGSAGGVAITPVLALSLINNTATARLGTGDLLDMSGALSVSASQSSTVTTSASGKAAGGSAAIGAALALALVDDVVVATTLRSVDAGGSIAISAEGTSAGTLTAEASASGAAETDDEGNSQDGETVDDNVTGQMQFGSSRQSNANVGSSDQKAATSTAANDEQGRSAKSEEGKVSVAAAVAVNVTNSAVSASVSGVNLAAGGALSLTSVGSSSGSATSDGSATDSQIGIGVAVSVNVVDATNTALLGAGTHSGNGVTVSATQGTDPDTYLTSASSGAGGSKVGIAGALALNLIDVSTSARIDGTATVSAGSGATAIMASREIDSTAQALPSGDGTSGGKVGIGASVALNLMDVSTVAELADGATLTDGAGLAVSATTGLSTTTTAQAGASGGIAIDAVVALAQLDTTTTARAGTGNDLAMGSGAVSVNATSTGAHKASADGAVKAGNVGVGAAAAVIIGGGAQDGALANTSITTATLARNVTAGSLEIDASSTRTYEAEATATAGGGKSDSSDSDKPAGNSTSTNTLAQTEDYQRGTDQAAANNDGTSGSGSGSGTSGSKVQVAAAVGVAASQDVVSATLAGGLTITLTDALSVTAGNTVDVATVGSGQAGQFGGTSNAQVGVGIGVGLGIINNTTTASIGNGTNVADAGSVAVGTTTRENTSAEFTDRLTARAIAGASSSKVSVAGAIAVGISLSSSSASVGDDVVISSDGAVSVTTDNQSQLGAKAMAAAYTSGSVGVGASIATVVSERSQSASIGAGATINGSDVSVTSINRKVDGAFQFEMPTSVDEEGLDGLKDQLTEGALLGASNYYAEAMGGAAAPSGVAIQGSFAVMVFSDEVTATIGESEASTAQTDITATGALTLDASSDFTARALSGGIAVGSSVGVGISATVIVGSGETRAVMAGNTSVLDSASVAIGATASQDYEAYGVSAAGASTAGVAGVAAVITSENTAEALVKVGAEIVSDGDVTLSAANDFASFALAGGAAAGGTAGIGAAGAVVVVDNITRAALADGTSASDAVTIDAAGAVALTAASTQSATTIAAAGGAAGTAGVGAGGAVYVLGTVTEALVGNHAQIGQTTRVGSLELAASDGTDLTTVSGAFGGGGTAGVGAAAAVGVASKATTARIGTGADVAAGEVGVLADNLITATTLGIGVGVGGTAGVAGAVGVFSIGDTTLATIDSNAVVHATDNVAVVALNGTSLDTISGGAGIGGTAGVGASVGVTLIDTTTYATIASNADVTALGQGAARQYRSGYNGTFGAYGGDDDINGPDLDNFEVDWASGDGDAPLTSNDAMAAGFDLLSKKRTSTPVTQSARGVIVNAGASTEIRSMAVAGAVGGAAGVALSADVPVINTDTRARIMDGAQINQGTGAANSGQSVVVAAASDLYHFGLAGSAAGGGAAGVGGGAAISIGTVTTAASIGNADVDAESDVAVTARAREDFMSTAAAGAVGGYAGVAGGVTTIVLDTTTTATLGGTVIAGGNVDVIADDRTRVSTLAGSIGLSGAVGVGASIGVIKMDKTVTSAIANNAVVTALGGADRSVYTGDSFSATRQATGLNVLANSNQSVFTLAVAGGGGLFVGVAGAITVSLFDVASTASIGAGAVINGDNTGADEDQDVVVVGRDSTSTLVIDGGVAGGAVGVAGAVDVAVFRNSSSGTIGDGATVNAARNVTVAGLSNKATSSTAVSAAGGLVGVAAGISIYNFGNGASNDGEGSQEITNATEDGDTNLESITGMADEQMRDGKANELLSESDNADVRSISQEAQTRRAALDFTGAVSGGTPGGTSATIGSATIDAGGTTSALTVDDLDARFTVGAIAGGVVGVGAGVGVVTVDTTNIARIVGGNISGGGVNVHAATDHTIGGLAIAGSLGFAAAVSADVAVLRNMAQTRATISGATIDVDGDVAVNADSTRVLDAEGYAASISGAAAVGVSVSTAAIGGVVEAGIATTTIVDSASVDVGTDSRDSATAEATAAAGGIGLALQGSVSLASITTSVSGAITGSDITSSGLIALDSQARQAASSDSWGLALGGLVAAGASIADARVTVSNAATVTNTDLDGGAIAIGSTLGPVSGSHTAQASATGSSGAFVGVTATQANAYTTASSNTLVTGSDLLSSGAIDVTADLATSQDAEAIGKAFGVVAVGDNISRARSTTTTTAIVRDMDRLSGGSVAIAATGEDANNADAEAGSGGVVAGTASRAETSATSSTRAAAQTTAPSDAYTIVANGEFSVIADHTALFGGKVDSTSAAAVGASGARLVHTVNSTVDAHLGNNATVRAGDFTLRALNRTHNFFLGEGAFGLYPGSAAHSFNSDTAGWNLDSGSGGFVDAPAGTIAVNIGHDTNATIGANADIHLLGKAEGVNALDVEAYNEVIAHQKAKLDSGGAVAIASTEILINANVDANVAIGNQSDVIVDIGDIRMAAWGQADLEARAVATTSGLAGAPSGKAYTLYTGHNSLNVGENVRLQASDGITPLDGSIPTNGTVSLGAGAGLDGREAGLRFRTTVDLFNNTAIPIDSKPDAQVVVTNTSNLAVEASQGTHPIDGANYGVLAAGDITLRAMGGNITSSAVGIGKNIYLEALSEVASAISNAFGGGDVTFEIHGGSTSINDVGTVRVDGLVATGLQRHKSLVISYATQDITGAGGVVLCDVLTEMCIAVPVDGQIGYEVTGPYAVGTDILNRLIELRNLLIQYGDDPVAAGAYRNEINFLERKLAALGLGSYVDGVFEPGQYVGPSPRQALLDEADGIQTNITTVKLGLLEATGGVVSADFDEWGSAIGAFFSSNADYGFDPNVEQAKTLIQGLSNYSEFTRAPTDENPNEAYNANIVTWLSNASTAADNAGTAAAQVASLTGTIIDLQTDVAALTVEIQDLQTQLAEAQVNNPSSAAGILQDIADKRSSIDTKLGQIATNNGLANSNAATARTQAASAYSNLVSAYDALTPEGEGVSDTQYANLFDDAFDPENSQYGGRLTRLNRAISGFTYSAIIDPDLPDQTPENITQPGLTTLASNITAYAGQAATKITTLTGNDDDSLTDFITTLTSLTNDYATKIIAAASAANTSGTPETFAIDVENTAARLGNVSVVADRLVGEGALVAPGDASISIVNNTANTLRLGNLLMPTYDAGRVRFNGVIVNSVEQINDLNPTGTAAAFETVETANTSSRPVVSIVSNYNPESLTSYNSSSDLRHLNTRQIAPDIILTSGSVISNLDGAVEITSAAGNIYINGEILAGSLSILAKNGDFVSSYVNGFEHIGGDPASFNIPTNWQEAGRGIIVNGAVSISARYLNINSTIQSGIANWSVNLGDNPTLTANTPGTIGITQNQIDAAIAQYQSDILDAYTNPSLTPSTRLEIVNDNGQTIVLNMAPAGLDETELRNAVTDYLTKVETAQNASAQLPDPVYTIGGKQMNIKDLLSPEAEGRVEFTIAQAQAYVNAAGGDGIYTVFDASSDLGVSYDAAQNRYVVDGTTVRGGYIQLYGQIMNTASSGGQLNVLDGFGTIDITNTSDIAVVLQTLNAGDDPTGNGRGTQGVIEITDVVGVDTSNPEHPRVDVVFTRYTRDYNPAVGGSGQVQMVSHAGFIDNLTGNILSSDDETTIVNASSLYALTGNVTNSTSGRSTTYDPTENQRYVWTTGEYISNTTRFKIKQTQLFGSSSLTISENTQFDSVDGPHVLDSYRLSDGTYVTVDETSIGDAYIIQTASGILLFPDYVYEDNANLSGTADTSSTDAYFTADSDTSPTETGRKRDCNWWTLCIASKVTISYKIDQKYTIITTNSLKADNPIAINFIGSDTGAVTVESVGDVVLTNNVNATAGSVSIASSGGSVIRGNLNAQIRARDIDLEAADSVGGVTNPFDVSAPVNASVAVDLTGGGALRAVAGSGSVLVDARGAVAVDEITAGGDVMDGKGRVVLTANGSISAADSASFIQAGRVVLTSVSGSIGSVEDGELLTVNTGFDAYDREFGDPDIDTDLNRNPWYGLSATASGDIGIQSESWDGNDVGTMLVDRVVSLGGDVRLAAEGWILDNNPVEAIDSRTYAQLLDYWNELGLVEGENNAAKQEATVTAFETSREQAYDQYWQIRQTQADGGAAYNPDFAVTLETDSRQYKALAAQYESVVRGDNPDFDDTEVGNAVAALIADYEDDQTNRYHDLNGQVGDLTTAYDADFTYDASPDEMDELTRGATWSEKQLAFSLSAGALKTVTSTNPVVKDANVSGRTVTVEAGLGVGETVGAGTTNIGVTIPGNIDPADLTIAQRVALASAERSDLELVVQFGESEVVIPLGTDYVDMTTDEQAAFDAAVAGDILSADMTIRVLSKRPLNFAAAEDINIIVDETALDTSGLDRGTIHVASRGDARLGTITAPGETRIRVLGTIINATSGSAVNTGNLVLEAAQGGIGAGTNPFTSDPYAPLQLALRDGATFTARAQNGIDVEFTGDALIDTVYSPGDIRLVSDGDLLNANNDLLINVLGTDVVLDAGGAIGTTAHALNVGNTIGGGITATATGLINLFGSAGREFRIVEATSQTGAITLTSGLEGIIDGTVTASGQISIAGGTRFVVSSVGIVQSTTGNIVVDAQSFKMIDGATMTALTGRIDITTDGDAQITALWSGSDEANAVAVVAGGSIFAGNLEDRVDIDAMEEGAGVVLEAGGGIGDRTQANADWQDRQGDEPGSANLITDVPNPLRIRTNTLDVAAGDSIYLETLTQIMDATIVSDAGDIYLWGSDSFFGTLVSAIQGHVMFDIQGDLTLEQLKARTFELSARGRLSLPDVEVAEEAILRAGIIEDVMITQVPARPPRLRLSLTGYAGEVGQSASLYVDAPAGIEIDQLYFYETDLRTSARFVSIADAFVPGALELTTPLQTLVFENRSPRPLPGNNVQMYQPDFAFSLDLDDYRTTTNAYVVQYDVTAEVVNLLDTLPFPGASLVRDTIRSMYRNGELIAGELFTILVINEEGEEDELEIELDGNQLIIDGVAYPVTMFGIGPMVNLAAAE